MELLKKNVEYVQDSFNKFKSIYLDDGDTATIDDVRALIKEDVDELNQKDDEINAKLKNTEERLNQKISEIESKIYVNKE